MTTVSEIFPGINIVDSDTHWSEPPDLWTSLAPTKYKDLVPQIKEHNGRRKWVVNGDIPIAGDSAVSAIMPDGEKMLGLRFLKADIDMVHHAHPLGGMEASLRQQGAATIAFPPHGRSRTAGST